MSKAQQSKRRYIMNAKVLTKHALLAVTIGAGMIAGGAAKADGFSCPVSYQTLKQKLQQADAQDSSGFNNHYWAVVVNRAGVVCAVAYSGPTVDSQWILSRQIAAAKA